MTTALIGTREAKTKLSEYLNRVAYRGERILVARHGEPVAALVSVADLRRLEAMDVTPAAAVDDEATRQALFRRLAEESGAVNHWPSGEQEPLTDFMPLQLDGPSLSEQIIAERR
jgi:prevent-host-death family protein